MRGFIILILLSLLTTSITSQERFNNRIDFGFRANNTSSVLVSDSAYYVTGIVIDTLSNDWGLLFSKLNLLGEVEYNKSYFYPDRDIACFRGNLIELENGNMWLSGYVADTLNGRNGFSVRLNSVGDTLNTYEFNSPYFPDDKHVTPLEMEYKENHTLAYTSNIFTQELGNHTYFSVYDTLGTLIFDKIINFSNLDITNSTFTNTEDGYILSITRGDLNIGEPANYGQMYLLKLDEEGNTIGTRIYPQSPAEYSYFTGGNHMIPTYDNNYLIGNTTGGYSEEDNIITNKLGFVKINEDLDTLWTTSMRTPGFYSSSTNTRMTEAIDTSGYIGVGVTFDYGNPYGHIAKVSPEGDSLWYREYSFIDWEEHEHKFQDVEATPDGGYIMVGYSLTHTPLANPPPPVQQGWIVKTDQYGCVVPDCHLIDTSSVSNTNLPKIDLKLYPNPTSDILNIFFRNPNGGTNGVFRIVDEQGRVVRTFESNIAEVTHVLSVSDYVGGVYFLQYIEEGEVLKVERFVIF